MEKINRDTLVGIRCSADEKKAMQINAHKSYKTLSKYLRDLALEGNE